MIVKTHVYDCKTDNHIIDVTYIYCMSKYVCHALFDCLYLALYKNKEYMSRCICQNEYIYA